MISDILFNLAAVHAQESSYVKTIPPHKDPFYAEEPKSIRLTPPLNKEYPAVFEFQYSAKGRQVLAIRVLRINIANLKSDSKPTQYGIQGLKLFYEIKPIYNIETIFENETSIADFFKKIHNEFETLLSKESTKFNVTSYSSSYARYWCQYGSSSDNLEEVCRRFVHQYNPPYLYLHFSGRDPQDTYKLIKNTKVKLVTDIEKEEIDFLRKYKHSNPPSC